jgi:tetratricopeptide (TPR) repeat protein
VTTASLQSDKQAQRARDLKNAAIKEMLQTRRLTEQNLLSEADLDNQEQKIESSLQTALSHVRSALAQNPEHEAALTQKVAILFLLERFEEANSTAEQGLRLYPDNPDLRDAQQKIQKHLASKQEAAL